MRDPVTNKEFFPPDEERLALLTIDPKPDMMPTPLGTRDYITPDGYVIFYNTPDYLKKVIPGIIQRKLGLELEISNVTALYNALRLANEGVFDKDMPLLLNYVMGSKGNQPATPRQLLYISEEGKRVFPQAKWEVTTSDENHWQNLALAISLGCNIVRVGFEDHFYLPNGEMAKHNVQLVESAISIAKDMGRDIATVDEAREILRLPS
jgi:3-keto-5-aminohexanoate cleavage enzyme